MSNINDRIDELELAMQDGESVDCKVTHNFIPGFYIRTLVMPAQILVTSRIHNTTHAYHISKGNLSVKINDEEWVNIDAPFTGITHPGTRRILWIENETTFSTFHPLEEGEYPEHMLEEEVSEALDRIEKRIIKPHVNPLLGGELKNNIVSHKLDNQ